jgi:hypothetical protein
MGGLRYIAPAAVGWLRYAWLKVGAKHISITEENWRAGKPSADPLIFHFEWS